MYHASVVADQGEHGMSMRMRLSRAWLKFQCEGALRNGIDGRGGAG